MTDDQPAPAELQCAPGIDMPAGAVAPAWIAAALERCPARRRGEISLRVVGMAESQALNRQFRGQDAPTNVLAFPADPLPGLPADASSPLGDLVVCMPVTQSEAVAQGKSVLAHFAHLVIHGTLHLLGFDHQSDAQARQMEALETEILRGLGFADPYAWIAPPQEATP